MTASPISLAPHIHLAWVGADVVALDAREDRYALLVDAAPIVRPGPPGSVCPADEDARAALASAGFLADTPRPPRPPLPAARRALEPPPAPTAAPLARMSATLDGLWATAVFRRRGFRALLAAAQARRPRRRRRPLEPAAALSAFYAVYPWLPWEGDCLQRAFLLHHHLHRRGVSCRWVFGVRAWPFLAHCWIQIDDLVIGDSLSRVRGFTPILAV